MRLRPSGRRIRGAALRAALVAAVVLAPGLALGEGFGGAAGLVAAGAAALAVLVEYAGRTPALLDFRFAPPVNRVRFAVFCAVLAAATLSAGLHGGAWPAAELLDFPWSPARLAADALTRASAPTPHPAVQATMASALLTAAAAAAAGALWVRRSRWPGPAEEFDALVNLPTFEPATGADAPRRLVRLGWLVIVTALATPFALLVLARMATGMMEPDLFGAPSALAWCAAIWAGLPATMLVRGAAILELARAMSAADAAEAEAERVGR